MDILKAVKNLYSSDTIEISEIEINEDGTEVLAVIDSNGNDVAFVMDDITAEAESFEYRYAREFSYPSIQEQLDMMYHDQMNGTTTWKDAITQVKTDNSKPTE